MNTQKGFAHAFFIIGLVVALIGALGFVFWQNFVHKEPIRNEAESIAQNKTDQPEGVSVNEGYVVIEKWGVRFKPSENLTDTNVNSSERNDQTNGTYFAFSTDRIKDLGGKCTEQPFADTVTLYRFTEKPRATPDGELVKSEPLGGYYYVLSAPSAGCTNFDSNENMKPRSEVETSDRDSLKESIKTLGLVE